MSAKRVVEVGTARAEPGAKAYGVIRVASMADGSPIEIPVHIVNGVKPGSTLYVQAAAHGNEVPGVEAIRRIVTELDPRSLSGTLIAVPVANVLAFRERRPTSTVDWRHGNLNGTFPGSPDGTIIERMAHAIWTQCVNGKANYVVDIHGADIDGIGTFFSMGYPKSEELAKVFGITCWEKKVETGRYGKKYASLAETCNMEGIPAITAEPEFFGRPFDEDLIGVVVKGVRNVMKHIGMMEGKPELPPKTVVLADRNAYLGVTEGGIFIPSVKPGDAVSEGDIVGRVYSIHTLKEAQVIRSTMDGVVWCIFNMPVVNAGDWTVLIKEPKEVIENPT